MNRVAQLVVKAFGLAIFLGGIVFLFVWFAFPIFLGAAVSGGLNPLGYLVIAAGITFLGLSYKFGIRRLWKWINREAWSSKRPTFFISSVLLMITSITVGATFWFQYGKFEERRAEKNLKIYVNEIEKCNQALQSVFVVHDVQESYIPEVKSVKLSFLTTVTEDIRIRPTSIIYDNVEYFKFFWADEVQNNAKGVLFSEFISGAYPKARDIQKGDSRIELIMIISPYVVSGQGGSLPWDGSRSFTIGPGIFEAEGRCIDGTGFVPGQNFSYKTNAYNRSDFGSWINGRYE